MATMRTVTQSGESLYKSSGSKLKPTVLDEIHAGDFDDDDGQDPDEDFASSDD